LSDAAKTVPRVVHSHWEALWSSGIGHSLHPWATLTRSVKLNLFPKLPMYHQAYLLNGAVVTSNPQGWLCVQELLLPLIGPQSPEIDCRGPESYKLVHEILVHPCPSYVALVGHLMSPSPVFLPGKRG
jgi:hypothetical protein